MRLLIQGRSGRRRKGVILLVVLSMLTLFALVGISFVLVADSQATSSRIAREAEQAFRPEIDAEAAFSLFLGQLLYDVPDDATGVLSALRGQSLARNMYGWNPAALNDKPYSGTGRLHTTTPYTTGVPATETVASTDAALMNYKFFPLDAFIRDPERPGSRAPIAPVLPYVGGFGVPYTYPDHNNPYLAEIDPTTGQVIVPSFHREYLFGRLDLPAGPGPGGNPNWTNPEGKYLTLRPRPFDNGVVNGGQFPMPLDRFGDVKNTTSPPAARIASGSTPAPRS